MKAIVLAFVLIGLAGCERTYTSIKYDEDRVIELFQDCLDRVPEGPQKTHYNDWDEVIEMCHKVARKMAPHWVVRVDRETGEVTRVHKEEISP